MSEGGREIDITRYTEREREREEERGNKKERRTRWGGREIEGERQRACEEV